MASKPFRTRLTVDDPLGRIVIDETVNGEHYPSERGREIAYGLRRIRNMLAAEFPGEFAEEGF